MNLKRSKKISTATFYNTVHALKSAGHLKEFSLENNTSYYDTNITSHHHFFDNGRVIDIKSDKITFHKLPDAPKGKKIKNVEVVIRLENNN
jgi:Fur family iron response transcriptional regulator